MLQKEIIAKERKIFDLERRLSYSAEEVRKLKDERDRLVEISNDLRAQVKKYKAECNLAQKKLDSSPVVKEMNIEQEEEKQELEDEPKLDQSTHNQKRVDSLSNIVKLLADQIKEWVESEAKPGQ